MADLLAAMIKDFFTFNSKWTMRKLISILVIILPLSSIIAQSFNEKLADSLGADEYGMKYYTFAILKTGKNNSIDPEISRHYFEKHIENIQTMAADGRLVVAGPFGNNDRNYRGLFIFNTQYPDTLMKWLENDPMITNDVLSIELTPWYGSAALPLYLPYHDQHARKPILAD